MDFIFRLYKIEEHINTNKLTGDKKHEYRLTHSKPIVDLFVGWCTVQLQRRELPPQHKLRKALNYVISCETELCVFLEDPQVAMDTNQLEREIRPITLGRKNCLFCWTELCAEHVGLIQSLISTCKLHGINPNIYLTDALQRISIHPAARWLI